MKPFINRCGAAQKIALHKVDARGADGFQLGFCLNALGDDFKFECARHFHQAIQYPCIAGVIVEVRDEMAVDFDDIDRKLL